MHPYLYYYCLHSFEMLLHSVYLDRLLSADTTLLTLVTKQPMFHYYPLHKKVPILDLIICHLVHVSNCQ